MNIKKGVIIAKHNLGFLVNGKFYIDKIKDKDKDKDILIYCDKEFNSKDQVVISVLELRDLNELCYD
jgi:hypothetical protein